MEQFIDNRRITLVARGTNRDWEATDLATSSVIAVDKLQHLLLTLVDSDSGRTIYWEHCGMLQDPQYRARWERKLDWYRTQGILPIEEGSAESPRVLVVTEDDDKGGISSQAIRQRIESLL